MRCLMLMTPARVADRLGVEHHVFNFGDDFERDVVAPYVR